MLRRRSIRSDVGGIMSWCNRESNFFELKTFPESRYSVFVHPPTKTTTTAHTMITALIVRQFVIC